MERQRTGQIPEPLGRQSWQEVVTREQKWKNEGRAPRPLGGGRPFMTQGAQYRERLILQCWWGIQGERTGRGLLGSRPQKRGLTCWSNSIT